MPSLKQSIGNDQHISLDDVCFLIPTIITQDALKQDIEAEIERQIFCSTTNISRQEFNVSSQAGLKADKVFIVDPDEYDGEAKIKYAGKKYSVYRTFVRPDNYVELYSEVRLSGN